MFDSFSGACTLFYLIAYNHHSTQTITAEENFSHAMAIYLIAPRNF